MELAFAAVTLPDLSKAGFSCGTCGSLLLQKRVRQTVVVLNTSLIELNILILFVLSDSLHALAGFDLAGT